MSADNEKKRARDWEDALLNGAGEVARTSDRWFVSVVEDVAGAGRWARREADVIGESMTAAFHTTVDVAKNMKSSIAPEGETAAERETTPRAPSVPPPNFDVLVGLNQIGVPSHAAESALTSHRSGIAPLLAALKEVVSSRTAEGYESLQSDERFWALVELIHEHNEKAQGSEGS